MRIDLGLILAIILEYIFFIYYADTLFYRKRKKYVCYSIIAAGYIFHFAICVFRNVILNTMIALIMHIICFRSCYYISRKEAVFQSFLLDALGIAAEYVIIFIPYAGIIPNQAVIIDSEQSFILTVTSKLIYLIGIMVISRIFSDKKQRIQSVSAGLLSIPVLTVVIIILLVNINTTSNLLSLICIILIIINIIIFAVNQKIIAAEAEKNEIERQKIKDKINYDEYMMLKESQSQTAILNRDIKEHIEALSSLIGADNRAAQEYINSISGRIARSRFIEYSDNKILNILLSKKKEECQEKGIKFLIDPIQARLQFLSDMDTVAIFANLVNNAMESCIKSKDKKIYLNVHTANKNFVVINMENTSDTEPIVIKGRLKTHKEDPELHGIGMSSITRALEPYNGVLTWEYNEAEKIFSTKIIIKIFSTEFIMKNALILI